MKECLNYKKIDKDRLHCFACAHNCQIRSGHRGVCAVRENINNKLFSLTYGRLSAVNFDPVEKKPLFHFLPGEKTLSFGSFGCNLACDNCQNFDISQLSEARFNLSEEENIVDSGDLIVSAKENGANIIANTYNEPTINLEYALDVMQEARKEKRLNVWVSNGFMTSQTVDLIVPYLDAINIDIKSFDNDFYSRNCRAKLESVLETCKKMAENKIWLEITTLLIPGYTDSKKNITKIAKFIKEELGDFVPWHLSAFSGRISWKMKEVPNTDFAKIREAWRIGREEGLKYVYSGNLSAEKMENTYCPSCENLLIERNGYEVVRFDDKGACLKCGEPLSGKF
ncbi:MAG: AmmeMemoRadiSam system radical SAM enzyme [Candidatus Moranbacteria bacterium]|nr:AmmeMemoRadiSam system radical SAM enzyme [Candidatus Moranbacteria bacterium]